MDTGDFQEQCGVFWCPSDYRDSIPADVAKSPDATHNDKGKAKDTAQDRESHRKTSSENGRGKLPREAPATKKTPQLMKLNHLQNVTNRLKTSFLVDDVAD